MCKYTLSFTQVLKEKNEEENRLLADISNLSWEFIEIIDF